eukprot:GHVS01057531.1.p1 GENE.GHVS01057531.1~~GHVS01057531.1.p1  ORF type:complete len:192 (+),score=50.15 GHVS01057531.1:589-1164(+)
MEVEGPPRLLKEEGVKHEVHERVPRSTPSEDQCVSSSSQPATAPPQPATAPPQLATDPPQPATDPPQLATDPPQPATDPPSSPAPADEEETQMLEVYQKFPWESPGQYELRTEFVNKIIQHMREIKQKGLNQETSPFGKKQGMEDDEDFKNVNIPRLMTLSSMFYNWKFLLCTYADFDMNQLKYFDGLPQL